jgi:Transposase DDE domain
VSGPTPRRLWKYVTRRLGLASFLSSPGDGRKYPQIPARTLLWALLLGQLFREGSFYGVESWVRVSGCRALLVNRTFSDDTLGYFTERLDVGRCREALVGVLRRAKRNKAFARSAFIGLALDGSTGCRRQQEKESCLCRSWTNEKKQIVGYRHHLVLLSVVGTGLSLPVDVEPYGPHDSEYQAGQRILRRAVDHLGPRFADYVVVDGEFATAPFLHTAGELGLSTVARLKGNLPELYAAAQRRFPSSSPHVTFDYGDDQVELWDAEDFDPWASLRWQTVRVIFYRQKKRDGTAVEAYWLTDFSIREVSSQALFEMAKSRWEIENEGFNEAKTLHSLEHLCHHHPNSMLVVWLLTALAMTIDRLYRQRYLHRGRHRILAPIDLVRLLRASLSRETKINSS